MLAPITIRYPIRPVRRSLLTAQVADLFGLPEREPPHTIAENLSLDIRPGDLVLFTGPSGSGKSSLLRAAADALQAIDANSLELPDRPLVESLHGTLPERLSRLAACGLSEARLLLRRPCELSDGQRYRFRIAMAIDVGLRKSVCGLETRINRNDTQITDCRIHKQMSNCDLVHADIPHSAFRFPHFICLDEFTANLDRTLARVVAFNLRKLVSSSGLGVLAATTHEDIADDLNPDLHVRCFGDGAVEAEQRDVKKNGSASPRTCGFPTAPDPTGRTSLGGITETTTSASSAA